MKNVTATQARKDIYNLIEAVELNHEPIQITSKRANAVLIAESDWRAIQETLHLLSIPDMRESIKTGLKTPLKKCKEELDW
jgi:antitoxin YefM